MKIILLTSPGLRKLEIYQSIGVRAPPLGLAYIASMLEKEGHKVEIIDAPTLGLGVDEVVYMVKKRNPDIVGISAVTPTIKAGYLIAKHLKEYDKNLPIVMGGPHVSAMYHEALGTGYVDYVVIGEGELTALELIDYLKTGRPEIENILGLAYIDKNMIVKRNNNRPFIRDLDTLPEPARHLLPMDHYTLFDKPIKIIHIMASRGCPYGCIYCTTSYFWGRIYRIRSPKLVAEEVEKNVEKYNTNIVAFSDDELTLSKRWILQLTKEFKERGLDITYTCGSRVNSIDAEMLYHLRKTGCNVIYYGVESYKDEDLVRIRKKITVRQVWDAIKLTHKMGIETAGSFILGFPWQTIEDMKNTVKFAINLDTDYAQFTVATPYPGTPLFQLAKRLKLIRIWDWSQYTTIQPVMRGFKFCLKDAGKILTWAYRKFYLRPKYMVRTIFNGGFRTISEIIWRAIRGYITRSDKDQELINMKEIEEIDNKIKMLSNTY